MILRKRGIYDKVINIILDILIIMFGIFLIISIYNNIQIKILGNEYSSFFGYSTFEVQTGSMADTINAGDWIIVKSSKSIKLDDIITFSQDGEFITHRVVETYNDTLVTKGDANSGKDDAIAKSQVVGKVVKILPGFGIIRKTFFNPIVLISLIVALYFISFVLRSSLKNSGSESCKNIKIRQKIDYIVNYILNKLMKVIQKHITKKDDSYDEDDYDYLTDNTELSLELPNINDKDIDKTFYFRMVPVDKNDLDSVNMDGNNIYKDEEIKEEEKIETDISEVEEKVNLIQNKKKKFKNIIDKAIYLKREEVNDIIDILNNNEKLLSNESSIREELMNVYIDAKYYNFCGDVNVEFNKRTLLSKIDAEIKKNGEFLIATYKGNDKKYDIKVNKFVTLFLVVNSLEQKNITLTDINEKRDAYRNKILKIMKNYSFSAVSLNDMVNKIIKKQKIYNSVLNYILDKFSTNMFNLNLSKVSGQKNMFAVSLEHNISFSKVYSDYIIDKTYEEGIIAEDKVMVLLNLLFADIIRDMFDADDNKEYLIHIPDSIYLKPNKLERIFKMFDDEYAKNNIIVVVMYNDLVQFNKQISNLRKKGYRFATVFDSNSKISKDNQEYMGIADYLFIDKKIMNYNLISSIPNDLTDSIIDDDIMSKLNSFGGE